MKGVIAAIVVLTMLFAATEASAADIFACEAGNCTGHIITSAGAVVPVATGAGGFIRVSDGHTFVATGGEWELRTDGES